MNRLFKFTIIILFTAISVNFILFNLTPEPWKDIQLSMKESRIDGAVVSIIDKDGQTYTRSIGTRKTPNGGRMTNETILPIASLSKPVTAAALRIIARKQNINIDETLDKHLPEASRESPISKITLRQLLNHSGGFDRHISGDPFFNRSKPAGCTTAINSVLFRELDFTPGSRESYSNTGYCLIGRIIEEKNGTTYDSAVQELLEITKDSPLNLGPPAGNYLEAGSLNTKEWKELGAAGGWFSTASELAEILREDVKDPSIAFQSHENFAQRKYYYGLGWRVWPVENSYYLSHYGSLPGMFSVAVGHPDGRIAIALFNGRPADDESMSIRIIKDLKEILE